MSLTSKLNERYSEWMGAAAPVALLLDARGVENRRAGEVRAPARDGNQTPAVRAANQVLGIDILLVADVQVVRDRAAERACCRQSARRPWKNSVSSNWEP